MARPAALEHCVADAEPSVLAGDRTSSGLFAERRRIALPEGEERLGLALQGSDLGWWDIDVALLVLGAALAGMVAGFFVSGCAVGLLLASAYGRAKAGKHPAFALHLLYWHLPAFMTGLKRTPPSYLRELAG